MPSMNITTTTWILASLVTCRFLPPSTISTAIFGAPKPLLPIMLEDLSIYASTTIGRNMQKGVATGQFNFDPDELGYIDRHYIVLDHQPLYGASGGITYRWKPYSFGLNALYSSGLRGGFADLESLPHVVQVDLNGQRSFQVPYLGEVTDRITLLNIFDRTNLIRPAEGIGIFQAAYGPRITVYDTLTVPLPALHQ